MKPIPEGDIIAAHPTTFAGKAYLPGDLFEWRKIPQATPHKVRQLVQTARWTGLSAASLKTAMKVRRRDGNSEVPSGFTSAELLERGLVTREDAEEYGWVEKPAEEEAEKPAPDPNAWTPPEGAVQVHGLWLVPTKATTRTVWDIYSIKGERLTATPISNKGLATAQAEKIAAERARNASPPSEVPEDLRKEVVASDKTALIALVFTEADDPVTELADDEIRRRVDGTPDAELVQHLESRGVVDIPEDRDGLVALVLSPLGTDGAGEGEADDSHVQRGPGDGEG